MKQATSSATILFGTHHTPGGNYWGPLKPRDFTIRFPLSAIGDNIRVIVDRLGYTGTSLVNSANTT
jgi:hypothetical protein